MAEVSQGSVSTMPGSFHHLPEGTMCDDHPDRPAVARIQGETDSMGCEYNDLCKECVNELREYNRKRLEDVEQCDWCKSMARRLSNRRDYDEGRGGPIYRVCQPCVEKDDDRLKAELDEYDGRFDDYDDGDWD